MFAKGFYQNSYSKEDVEAEKLFEDVSDEENEKEIEIVPKVASDTDAISILLSAYCGECEDLPGNFRKHGIKFANLAAVTDEDLKLLGLKNPQSRKNLLTSLASLSNQAPHFNSVVDHLDVAKCKTQILENVASHLKNLKTSLMVAEIKFGMAAPDDVLLEDQSMLYASDIVLKTIDQMLATTETLETVLDELKPKGSESSANQNGLKSTWLRKLIGYNLVVGTVAVASFMCFKYLK